MKRIVLLLLVLHFSLFTHHLFAQSMSEVFQAMPDTLLPLLTERNRHDMIDFYGNHMEAKVRNRMNDYARLDTLTEDYLHLTLSKVGVAEMKLLQTEDSMTIVCLIRTVEAPARDSQVEFYDTRWTRLHWLQFPVPDAASFFNSALSDAPDVTEGTATADSLSFVQRSIDDLRLVEVTALPDAPVFTLHVATDQLDKDEKRLARRFVHPLRYRWTGSEFVRYQAQR